jgi:putative flavoprotein involved in K+ transport
MAGGNTVGTLSWVRETRGILRGRDRAALLGRFYAMDDTEAHLDYDAVVLGAGAAGLASAAMLERAGVRCVVLERTGHVGSTWRGRYDRLRLNTLGWMSTLPGYHVGWRARHFHSRDEWVDYLERYTKHHRLQIEFDAEARRVDRDDGHWRTETAGGVLTSKLVVVATGYDRVPAVPDWPGRDTFAGELIHSAKFRNADPYRGRDTLVVGPNVTGSEIAFFLSDEGAARVRVAVRTPPSIIRRCRFGVPLNPVAVLQRLPAAAGDRAAALSQRITFGDLSPYGLPPPELGLVSTNRKRHQGPVVDDGFVSAVKRGDVEIVAAVEGFDRDDVILATGERIQPDAVIAATGYQRGLEPLVGHLGVLDEDGRPYFRGPHTHPNAPGLHFAGFETPIYGALRGMRIEARRLARAARAWSVRC